MWGEIDPKDKARLETLAATVKAKWEKEKVGRSEHFLADLSR